MATALISLTTQVPYLHLGGSRESTTNPGERETDSSFNLGLLQSTSIYSLTHKCICDIDSRHALAYHHFAGIFTVTSE